MAFWQITRLRIVYPVLLVLLLFVDGALMAGMGGIFTAFPWHVTSDDFNLVILRCAV